MQHTVVAAILLLAVQTAWAADDVAKSGKQLYEQYCGSCHGADGRGNGPVAKSLTVEVPDLTRFAQRHGGFFDRELVERIIDGRHVIGAHFAGASGTRTMPVWGEDLATPERGNPNAERATRIVITRLADYLWQLQHADTRRAPDKKN